MRRDRPANADIVRTSFKRLAGRHESFLIARLGPRRAHSLNSDFDFVAKFRAKLFDSMWTADNSVDSCFDTQPDEAQDLVVHFAGDSNLAQRLFSRACYN